MKKISEVQRVRGILEDDIIYGVFQPGEKLSLVELGERFGCSRTPLRDALQYLEQSGLVEIRPKHGTYVKMLSLTDLVQRFEVMAELEGMATRLASKTMTSDELDLLSGALDDCAMYGAAGDADGYYEANSRFHGLMYDCSGNIYLREESYKLRRMLRPYRRIQLKTPHRLRQSLVEHRSIFEAVSSGEPENAGRLAREHVLIQVSEFGNMVRTWNEVNRPSQTIQDRV